MLLILVGMVLLLVGIQHYLSRTLRHTEMDDTDNDDFRREINSERGVMSGYNLFRRFLADDDYQDTTPSVPRFFQGEGSRPRKAEAERQLKRRNS